MSVTLVTSLPPGPGEVAAATWTGSEGRFCRAVMSAYWLSGAPLLACGLPSVVSQSITSCWVDIQYTLRSTTTPCWRRVSSTKYALAGAGGVVAAGTCGVSTEFCTPCGASDSPFAVWLSSTWPLRS